MTAAMFAPLVPVAVYPAASNSVEGKWRETHPALVAWLDSFDALVPAFEATKVTG